MDVSAARRMLRALVVLLVLAPTSGWARPDSFAPLVKKVLPAVVNIAVTEEVSQGDALAELPPALRGTPFEQQFRQMLRSRREQVMGAGSGFVIDPAGIIVTNNHVVGHAEHITVSFTDGSQLPAHVVGTDELTDIAVIKVDTDRKLPAVPWGDSRQVEVGDWILAAGNPFGLGGTVTTGIVSARGRDIGAGPFDDFLQLDASINPGNSGGPTFNMDGAVVGVNTAIVSPSGGSVGIGFAIPSEIARPIVETLLSNGSIARGWLGVSVADRAEDAPEPPKGSGVTISAVERGGPAARAGVHAGDVVQAVNGERVDSARDLIRSIAVLSPGKSARLSLVRHGKPVELNVTIGRRPNAKAG